MKHHEKLAKKLLNTAEGRAALSKHLGGARIVKPSEVAQEKAIVATLTPCYHHPEPAMTEAYVRMCEVARENGIAVYNGSSIRDSSVVHWSRNQLLANLIKSKRPWTHVLFIDDDIVAPEDALVKMVNHQKDIVGALCTRRQDPPIPTLRHWHEEGKNFQEIFEWGTEGLVEAAGIGRGMVLISRHALEEVAAAWFNCLYEKEVYGVSEEWIEKHRNARLARFDESGVAMWFDFLYHIDKCDSQYGEDMSFCLLAKRYCNIPIHVDTSITPGHLGEYAYSVADFLPYRESVKADYQRKLYIAATLGKELPPIEKPAQEKRKTRTISVLIPTRNRERFISASQKLMLKADIPSPIEFLYNDEQRGYESMHEYYNEMAARATGDWLMLWGDDVEILTQGWDEKIHEHGGGLKILNLTGKLNLFPVISRELYETLGHVSLQPHCDSWLQVIGRLTGIEEDCPLEIQHTPREQYETDKAFFTDENFALIQKDIDKVKAALKPEAVAVG